jgi:hypothetical protein
MYDLYETVYTYDQLQIEITIYNRFENHNIDPKKIVELVQIIRKLKKSNEKIKIYIIGTEQKKMLYKNFTGLGPVHVNSGMSMDHTHICVWRVEELYKVLIHELIHYYRIDSRNNSDFYLSYDNQVRQILNYSGTNYLFEAYTEFLAVIIHSMWLISFTDETNVLTVFYEIINDEIRFQKLQCKKILDYYGINNLGERTINTYTSVISYYFLKYKLFDYFFIILDKLSQDVNIDEEFILGLIVECSKRLVVEQFPVFIIEPNSYISNNLRMTAHSI